MFIVSEGDRSITYRYWQIKLYSIVWENTKVWRTLVCFDMSYSVLRGKPSAFSSFACYSFVVAFCCPFPYRWRAVFLASYVMKDFKCVLFSVVVVLLCSVFITSVHLWVHCILILWSLSLLSSACAAAVYYDVPRFSVSHRLFCIGSSMVNLWGRLTTDSVFSQNLGS